MPAFEVVAPYEPRGDQPAAIKSLADGFLAGRRYQTLLGVTGSGKTFSMAHVIAALQRPTLVLSHNKTLAAQLFSEFREFFPKNAVHYFVSYYDYYQPEAYIPQKDIYIEKDADINEDIDRLRLAATTALLSRPDVVIVASVSCIYGLGSPEDYKDMIVPLAVGYPADRDTILKKLVNIQYERNDTVLARGKFRCRGDTLEIWPAYEETAIRIQLGPDVVERLARIDPLTGTALEQFTEWVLFPAKHFVMPQEKISQALAGIEAELEARLGELRGSGKLLEAQRLEARTRYDIEMLQEVGYCKGIENYSRHLSGRAPGQRPFTLLDYFPKDFLCMVDESHVSIPQVRGMYNGDRSRKETLVEYGFRLPSALDNRPMRFEEWEALVPRALYVSATPDTYELTKSAGRVAEQIIRPTGLLDPKIDVRPAQGQVEDLLKEVEARVARNERALVTTLTKRLAEDLANYMQERNIKGRYLHSEVQTMERVQILRDLREGKFDVLVGVNLLREGLDLPEVTLVAILDADKEGFLRSETSIIQTVGRTARNVNGAVILYADKITNSMRRAMDETERRRAIQLKYNQEHGITPRTIEKEIRKGIEEIIRSKRDAGKLVNLDETEFELTEIVKELEREMFEAAEKLDFERAAELRDEIRRLSEANGAADVSVSTDTATGAPPRATRGRGRGRGSGSGKGKTPEVRGEEARRRVRYRIQAEEERRTP
ncbi:MAG: excinuclease ABC subunit UvrB [Planctomycetes bacterium]|nr:excinuclease ABC subunit UvrB [Planctomycetota bacterium]